MVHLLSGIDTSISTEVNIFFTARYTEVEVYAALKEMGPTKTPGADGFPTLFYQCYWYIVGGDVIAFCVSILNDGKEFDLVNNTDIMFIPKCQNPTNSIKFRPINLCTILYKIVAKVITNCL